MKEVFEYRRTRSKGAIWLSASAVAMLIAAIAITGTDELIGLVYVAGPVTLCWMLMPQQVAGIRIDDQHLVLSAWRQPRAILLDDIAYLRVTEASAETNIAIVYKDGREEGTYIGDMPDLDTLARVMAARGIAVRDIY
ncbi:hypothetical protein [Yoonia sp. BS5-3]|uniref:PH domain-containing protein n=1 Tax=Yoonia phaeophyticola TaxID=3137369 RepID=A0ABZ2VC27_9RHOB